MTETFVKAYYDGSELLEAIRSLLEAHLPASIPATVQAQEVEQRAVNLWPQTPSTENLTMAGPTHGRLRFQATCLDVNALRASKTGDRVRTVLTAKTSRGRLVTPPALDGYKIDAITASEGHADYSGNVGRWVEVYEVLFQAPAVDVS